MESIQTKLVKARGGELNMEQLKILKKELVKVDMLREAIEVSDVVEQTAIAEAQTAKAETQEANKKLKRSRDILERSIANVYRCNDKPSYPKLELNRHVQPSIKGHQLKGMNPQNACYAGEERFSGGSIWDRLSDVVVPTCVQKVDGNGMEDIFDIDSNFNPLSYPLTYDNEIGVQFNSQKLVDDAIRCLGYGDRLRSSMEITFYGITPDILVVCKNGRMIFVMEIKSPDREGTKDNVMESELVGGQIWLYLMIMKQAGIDNPLGAICTFNKMRIVSLQDLAKHTFETVMKSMTSDIVLPLEPQTNNDKNADFSPDPKRQQASERTRPFEKNNPGDAFDAELTEESNGVKVFKAYLYGGKIVETTEIFPMLLVALKTAYQEAQPLTDYHYLTEISVGDYIGNRLFVYGKAEKIQMAKTSEYLRVKKGFPFPSSTNFHLLSKIGKGSQGEVHLAVSTSGYAAAVKFYYCRQSREASAEKRKKKNEDFRKEVEEKCDKEFELWKCLYPGRARKRTLGGLPCLLMPYGKALHIGEREQSIETVESELQRFWDAGYLYKKSDMRWRHVLRDLDGNIFLADLGSLEKKKNIEDDEEHFRKLLIDFKKRAKETLPANESNGAYS